MAVRGLTAAMNGAGRYKYKNPEYIVDHLVIGGGVVGLSIAQRLIQKYPDKSTYLVERHQRAGEETSSRNSEVIHAGLYYPVNSNKLRLCVRGKQLLYERCQSYSVPHSKLGKLVVGLKHQREYLERLYTHCQAAEWPNNAPSSGLSSEPAIEAELISGDRARELEPDLSKDITHALWSHSTGIIDSHALMESLEQDIKNSDNGELVYATNVVRVDPYLPSRQTHGSNDLDFREEGWVVQTSTQESQDALLARTLINASGLSSHLILNSLLPDPIPIYFARGSYAAYKGPGANVSRLIYPVPEVGDNRHSFHSLGTHLTLDLNGNIRFGPDLEFISPPTGEGENSSAPEDLDFWVRWLVPDESRIPEMYEAVTKYLPNIAPESLAPDYVGIRPKLVGPGGGFTDFVFRTDFSQTFLHSSGNKRGAPMVSLMGIESPGLTSCLAIAEHVVDVTLNQLQ